jgi:phosphoglycolate phosphatase
VNTRLILFDVDGTLVDSQDIIVAAQGMAFAAHGLPAPSRVESLSVVGLSLVEAFRTLAGPDGPAEALADSYKSAFHTLRADPAHHEPFFPGALDAIETLAARPDIVLGVATGKSQRGVAHIIERAGWTGAFATIQTADGNPSKPAPGMILKALADTGIAASDAMMVGDTSFDMLMARAAGVTPLGVAWGYHPVAALAAAGAVSIASNFDDVLLAIDSMPAPASADA